MAKVIKGKFRYKDVKKNKLSKSQKRKEYQKLLRKQDKELKMRCECNHIDCDKNKLRLDYNKDKTIAKCKICGAEMYTSPDALDKASITHAVKTIYSAFSLIRNRLPISEEVDKNITRTLLMNMRVPELMDNIREDGLDKKKNKNKKKNNKKKDNDRKKKGSYRINY